MGSPWLWRRQCAGSPTVDTGAPPPPGRLGRAAGLTELAQGPEASARAPQDGRAQLAAHRSPLAAALAVPGIGGALASVSLCSPRPSPLGLRVAIAPAGA